MNKTRTLDIELQNRNNGLDIIKMMAAVLVILSHSIPITRGMGKEDFLSIWTKGYLNLGGIAVAVFFFFGGIYIAKSAESKKTVVRFFKARCKRIFPELWMLVILCVILGCIFSTLSLESYFTNSKTYQYLLNGVFYLQHNLPGVFQDNVYKGVVNGPLWTLPVEFACYIGCFLMYKLGLFQKKRFAFTIPFAILGIIGTRCVFRDSIFLLTVLRPVFLFYLGIFCYVYREKIVISTKYAIIAAILFVGLIAFKLQLIAMILVFPYLMMWFVYQIKKDKRKIHFDYTYGMYLWGWPIQQSFVAIFHGKMSWEINAVLAVLLAIVIGYISNKIVSKIVK